MTDYTTPSGSGELLLRDTGTSVQFFFKAGYSSDYYTGLAFNWTANGVTTSQTIDYPSGGNWYEVGAVNIGTSQTVSFRLLTSTGVSGMGGPTTISIYINRSGVPEAPTKPTLISPTATTIGVRFADNGNGGLTITQRQIGYSNAANGPKWYASSNGWTTVGGLSPGTTYYFWARCYNADGWGPWSTISSMATLNVPSAPAQPFLSNPTADTVDVGWTPSTNNGGSTILKYQIGYSTASSGPSTIVDAGMSGLMTVTGLQPGVVYYFWVRAVTAVGNGAWSPSNYEQTVAGAYIFVEAQWHPNFVLPGQGAPLSGGWHQAVPYVNVAGVWKPAEVWVRNVGVWSQVTF